MFVPLNLVSNFKNMSYGKTKKIYLDRFNIYLEGHWLNLQQNVTRFVNYCTFIQWNTMKSIVFVKNNNKCSL